MNIEEIKNIIKSKKSDIDEKTLYYFSNYFYVLLSKEEIRGKLDINELIDNALIYASKIEFYDENHPIYQRLGKDVKGLRDPESRTIFIRDNLPEPLREITVYHEIHHGVQTNPINNEVGINQEVNYGRLIMESQTQYFAEEVYKTVHNVDFEERHISSEKIRMQVGGTVVSKLHNYELYDNLLTKLAILLDVSKDYFVLINFLYKDNIGIKDLEERYNIARERYKLPYSFDGVMQIFDTIYCTDLLMYIENDEKEALLNGKETKCEYEIHKGMDGITLSQKKEFDYITNFDRDNFLALFDNNGPYGKFANYVVDNRNRQILQPYMSITNENESGVGAKRS